MTDPTSPDPPVPSDTGGATSPADGPAGMNAPRLESLDEWRARAQVAELGGYRMAWWTNGDNDDSKPFLVLIHGFPTSSWDWSAIWPALSPHFRLIAMDMLGFGLSQKPRRHAYSIFEQADLIEALLERIGVSEAHLLAHDYGDTVAQELLARHTEHAISFAIKSVVFLNGGIFPEIHRPRIIQRLGLTRLGPIIGAIMSRDRLRVSFHGIYGEHTKASDQEIDGHWSLIKENNGTAIFHRLLRYIPERHRHRARWVDPLNNTAIPLRLINGGADPVSGAHLYDHYCKLVRNADAVLLPEIGHYPQTEAPLAVLEAFFDFHRTRFRRDL